MVPKLSAVRPRFPSLKTIIPIAPAAIAFSAFTRNVHVPRCISAMVPARLG